MATRTAARFNTIGAMGKASRTKQDSDRRARIAAQREAERRSQQRKRIYLAGGAILVVAIVVVALVLVKLNGNSFYVSDDGIYYQEITDSNGNKAYKIVALEGDNSQSDQ